MGGSRGSWSGQLGFVLAAAGSAIGLGNIWMFPYRTGVHGGGAFVLVYLAAVLVVGVPLMVAEVGIGRSTGLNPVGAFRRLRPGLWSLVGWLGVVAGFVILSFYGVVAGWAMDYSWRAASGTLFSGGAEQVEGVFGELTASAPRQVAWQAVFMVASVVVVGRGIEAGIEKASKVLLPLLLAFMLVLLGYSLTSPGVGQGLEFLFRPRFGDLGWNGVLAALGQAFFSLSLGMGAMITYGSYLGSEVSVPRAVLLIAGLDTLIAILAGLMIFPLVFSFGLEPGAGPGLVFITLPKVLALMPAPRVLATLFFSLVIFAALTSAISLLEVVVAFIVDEWGWPRRGAAWGAGVAIFALGVPSAVVAGFLDHMDTLATTWMLPIGGLLIAVFSGWALSTAEAEDGYLGRNGDRRGFAVWRFCVRYLAPAAVAGILLQNTGLFG